ncbi:hypothetical protein GO594_07425 [Pseudomonas otitidis]|uniref:Uncharacterized protein n=1 Tax=Metapseudomonas otitidis TaxID=319939 RepID=A0A679GQP7_9GAMM|nr:hypothetical protein [Pseudomonas otitidis]MWK55800.1 hypothetical protein [Pseudomonas otitidis]BCA28374.1 hypothetical protein PtoMrB4_23510 [Pseudomonas otitidis]
MSLPQLRGYLRALNAIRRSDDRLSLCIARAAGAIDEDFKAFMKSL